MVLVAATVYGAYFYCRLLSADLARFNWVIHVFILFSLMYALPPAAAWNRHHPLGCQFGTSIGSLLNQAIK